MKCPDLYCPECNKEVDASRAINRSFAHRLETPYYYCNDCGLIYYNRVIIATYILEYIKRHYSAGEYCYESFESLLNTAIDDVKSKVISFKGFHEYTFKRFRRKKKEE